VASFGQRVVGWSLASVKVLITLLVIYLILVPLLVFFFLKDKDLMIGWVAARLPRERSLVDRVWTEAEGQIANYVRNPAAIILAILVFGGLWGFWGVFFAIPLATLVKAVINAWPKKVHPEPEAPS
jgi:putative permease